MALNNTETVRQPQITEIHRILQDLNVVSVVVAQDGLVLTLKEQKNIRDAFIYLQTLGLTATQIEQSIHIKVNNQANNLPSLTPDQPYDLSGGVQNVLEAIKSYNQKMQFV